MTAAEDLDGGVRSEAVRFEVGSDENSLDGNIVLELDELPKYESGGAPPTYDEVLAAEGTGRFPLVSSVSSHINRMQTSIRRLQRSSRTSISNTVPERTSIIGKIEILDLECR